MSLPPEKASELKKIIHNHLLKMDIHGKIREVLAEVVRDEQGAAHQSLSEADFLRALQRRGIVNDMMKDLHFTQEANTDAETGSPQKPDTHFADITQMKKTYIDPSRRYLYLQVLGGRAFLEHLQEPERLPGQVCSTFTLYLHFRNQRFRSKPVPCGCEPDLREGFLLEIHRDGMGEGTKMADATTMLSMCDPVHLVLIKTDTSSETTLVSSYFLDWRAVLSLSSGKTCLALELMGVGSECKVPAGVLTVSLELYPPLTETLSTDIISTQQSLERQRTAEKERLFLVYAKQWWREFLEIRPSHKSKMVKIFAQGDCEDHATLLCSLLLGFGLDAYVCVGTKAKGVPHTWVLTRGTDGSITFWESLTAHRYLHHPIDPDAPPLAPQPKPSSPYRTVGCVFNHQIFLANCQPSDAVDLCVFDFQNQTRWKAMSEEALKSVCAPGSTTSLPPLPPLCAPALDPASASNQLELEMRYLVSEHRKDLGLVTVWDDHLSYLLSSALSVYELERCTGVSCGNEEFQDAVRRAVPEGHTFKGFPIHFLHCNARRAFATCLRSAFCEEIVCCRGDHMRLAIRVRVFVYPENACAVWLMFACKYLSVL
ncbi:centrosomal protein of 76 kDa isoform X2 [Channa argus]|uniref:centrosomal protein of 76 kDa isoform X2 n=1 Tax=Channa argus TaxID=215402 RepID=UPI003520AB73